MIFGDLPKLTPIAFKFSLDKYSDWSTLGKICIPRMEYAAALPISHLVQADHNQGACIIVGAGPTVNKFIDEIKETKNKPDYTLCAINRVHEFLIKKEIIPQFHVIFENDIEDVEQALGGPPHKDVTYYISSHCHENVFKQLKDFNCILWHPALDEESYRATVKGIFPDEPTVGGDAGHITFFRSLAIAHLLGYRRYELYGIDSSFEDSDHIEGYKGSDVEPRIKVWARKKTTGEMRQFTTNGTLAFQAYRFIFLCDGNLGLRIRVHGDTLLRFIHQGRYPEMYAGD